jgi:hypothetical protein
LVWSAAPGWLLVPLSTIMLSPHDETLPGVEMLVPQLVM